MRQSRAVCTLLTVFAFIFSGQPDVYSALHPDKNPRPQEEQKLIVLTFDDGPRPYVLLGTKGRPGLIEVLESPTGIFIPAHFFVIGGEAEAHAGIVKTLSSKGFYIENHTYGHENLVELRKKKGEIAVIKTIQRAAQTVARLTGRPPHYVRPPYWALDTDTLRVIETTLVPGTKEHPQIVALGDPDINTLDYDDYAKKRPASVLIDRVKQLIASREKQGTSRHVLVFHELPNTVDALKVLIPYFHEKGYRFGTLDDYFAKEKIGASVELTNLFLASSRAPVRAVYLAIDYLYNQKKIEYLERLIDTTELNAVVIDFKVGRPEINEYMEYLIERFHKKGVYVIGRMVVFQDSYLAKTRPHLAVRDKSGALCYSGKKEWGRYWVDMASDEVQEYNIKIAKEAVDIGFDEINFDYIRFPSDFGPNCNTRENVRYPVWSDNHLKESERRASKYAAMRSFYAKVRSELKAHARERGKNVTLSIDIFGEVFLNGKEPGIGQKLSAIAEFFDVISPMPYPSHYKCGEFGVKDPNARPNLVYKRTLASGLAVLSRLEFKGEVRPWIQDFSLANIYGCGPHIVYGPHEVRAEIEAAQGLGIEGFMLWNGASSFTKGALLPE